MKLAKPMSAWWRTALAFVAGLCVFGAYATDYYVDANNGNDDWDGTTATIPLQEVIDQGGTIPGPRKTLHAMMSDARVVAGTTVWAAEGESIALSVATQSTGRTRKYELVYKPEGGEQTVIHEKTAEPFSYTLDGACTVQSLNLLTGFIIDFK